MDCRSFLAASVGVLLAASTARAQQPQPPPPPPADTAAQPAPPPPPPPPPAATTAPPPAAPPPAAVTVVTTPASPPPNTVMDQGPDQLEEDDNGVRRKIHEPLFIGLDFLIGFGNYGVGHAAPNAVYSVDPNGVIPDVTYQYSTSQVRTETFLMLAHYRFKKFGIGLRMPIIVGHIADADALGVHGEDVFTNGNLEASLDMPRRLSEHVRYLPEIALTLPFSQGSTPPYYQSELTQQTCGVTCPRACTVDPNVAQSLQDKYNHYAVGVAAAFARGGEDDALFLNWRLGITPKIAFDMKFNHTKVIPYVKIPIMVSLESGAGDAEEPLRIEAVGGLKVAQEIGPVQIGVRVVGMIPIAARTTLKTPMLSVWPEIRLQLTPAAQFWLSGMIPLAGDYNVFDDGKNGAFQAGLAATF